MITATMSTFLVLVYEDTYLKRPGYFLIKLFTVTGNIFKYWTHNEVQETFL